MSYEDLKNLIVAHEMVAVQKTKIKKQMSMNYYN